MKYTRTWEDRFVFEEGYQKVLPVAVGTFLKKKGLAPKDIAKVVFTAPDLRRHREMGKALGFQPNQIQEPFFSQMGATGAAFGLMLLAAALEDAAPGDKILLVNYGDGADIFLLQVTDKIQSIKGRKGMKAHLASKMVLPDFDIYLAFREFTGTDPNSPGGASASVIHRERDMIYRMQGERCKTCGTLQYPPQRVCTNCHTKDNFEPARFSDKKGKLFTYTLKYGGDIPSFARPMVDSMVDFEGGGRAVFGMTDTLVKNVKVGLEVEMTFRTLGVAGGIHNYSWRCMPLRESWEVQNASSKDQLIAKEAR
jgi:hydroxymethylglutaryl-CoA synthase